MTKETQNGMCRREKDVCSMCLLCRERRRCCGNRQQGCLTQTQTIRSLGATYTESRRGVAATQVRIQRRSYVLGRESDGKLPTQPGSNERETELPLLRNKMYRYETT